ncbi:MAG TPA: TetR/AcrR family transcriptional regulator [Steroidobacteraceae bacterium]
MRYEPDRKQRTREKVLRAAAKAIRAQGPHRVGVAQVMGKAGLTHGGFYAHFSSKDALIAAAIRQMFQEGLSTWDSCTQGKGPAESLNAYVDFYLSPAHRDAVGAGCPIPALAPELRRLTKSCRDEFAKGVAALTERICTALERLGIEKADEEASSMLAEMVGALALARAEPDTARSNAILEASKRRIKARFAASAARST